MFEGIYEEATNFYPENYKISDVIEFEYFLRDRVKGQDENISSICRVLMNNSIRTEEKPLFFFLSGPSWTWKDYIAKSFAEFFASKSHSSQYPYFEIDVSQYYLLEFKTFSWVSNAYDNWAKESLLENIANKAYESYNWTVVVNFTEIDKGRIVEEKSTKLQLFFESMMNFLENRFIMLKWWKTKNSTIDMINFVFFFSWNFLFDSRQEKFKKKIWFYDEEKEESEKRDFENNQKVTKEDFLNYLKGQLSISVYNRLTADKNSIILMNEIDNSVKKDIFILEYKKMIQKIKNNYRDHDKNKYLEKYINPNQTLLDKFFKKSLKAIDKTEWARWFRNYINSEIKSEIIDTIIEVEVMKSEEKYERELKKENKNNFINLD